MTWSHSHKPYRNGKWNKNQPCPSTTSINHLTPGYRTFKGTHCTATWSTKMEEAAHGRILTCTGVGLGGWSPRWLSYLAGHFDPSGLGGAHVSSCDLLDPQVLCRLVGTDWAQTMKTTGCSSVMLKLFSPHQNQWNKKIKIKTNQKVKQKGKKGGGRKSAAHDEDPVWRKKQNKTLLDFILVNTIIF